MRSDIESRLGSWVGRLTHQEQENLDQCLVTVLGLPLWEP